MKYLCMYVERFFHFSFIFSCSPSGASSCTANSLPRRMFPWAFVIAYWQVDALNSFRSRWFPPEKFFVKKKIKNIFEQPICKIMFYIFFVKNIKYINPFAKSCCKVFFCLKISKMFLSNPFAKTCLYFYVTKYQTILATHLQSHVLCNFLLKISKMFLSNPFAKTRCKIICVYIMYIHNVHVQIHYCGFHDFVNKYSTIFAPWISD
jgi:hypothetical protein